jgi:hypothetical protein
VEGGVEMTEAVLAKKIRTEHKCWHCKKISVQVKITRGEKEFTLILTIVMIPVMLINKVLNRGG